MLHIGTFRMVEAAKPFGFAFILRRSKVRNAGTELEDFFIILPKHLDVPRHFRPRTDQTHLSFNHIDQLSKLVDLGLAQKASDACDTGISANWECQSIPGGIVDHRTKLVNQKGTKTFPDPFLSEKDWSMRVDFNKCSCQHE